MHILVVHAMVILLTLGPPRGKQPVGKGRVAAPGLSRRFAASRRGASVESEGPAFMGVPWSGRVGESSPCLSRGFWGSTQQHPHGWTTDGQAVTPHCPATLACGYVMPMGSARVPSCAPGPAGERGFMKDKFTLS